MTPRLYIPAQQIGAASDRLDLDSRLSHYLCQVLRLREGDAIEVFDGIGNRFSSFVIVADKRRASIQQPKPTTSAGDHRIKITLMQGIARGDRMDWVIEKATELGVHRIIPLLSDRSTVRLDSQRAVKRQQHWQRICEAACMQCGLDTLPDIQMPVTLEQAVHANQSTWGKESSMNHLLHLSLDGPHLLSPWAHSTLAPVNSPVKKGNQAPEVALAVGPESGFSEAEEKTLVQAGAIGVGLGPRVLRTETAGVVAISLIQAVAGDLGSGS
ncbi:MAG: 16S rRNA (uracil(1498)-N(3))-methyltransferase [Burkholderiaceae bacterium]